MINNAYNPFDAIIVIETSLLRHDTFVMMRVSLSHFPHLKAPIDDSIVQTAKTRTSIRFVAEIPLRNRESQSVIN